MQATLWGTVKTEEYHCKVAEVNGLFSMTLLILLI